MNKDFYNTIVLIIFTKMKLVFASAFSLLRTKRTVKSFTINTHAEYIFLLFFKSFAMCRTLSLFFIQHQLFSYSSICQIIVTTSKKHSHAWSHTIRTVNSRRGIIFLMTIITLLILLHATREASKYETGSLWVYAFSLFWWYFYVVKLSNVLYT